MTHRWWFLMMAVLAVAVLAPVAALGAEFAVGDRDDGGDTGSSGGPEQDVEIDCDGGKKRGIFRADCRFEDSMPGSDGVALVGCLQQALADDGVTTMQLANPLATSAGFDTNGDGYWDVDFEQICIGESSPDLGMLFVSVTQDKLQAMIRKFHTAPEGGHQVDVTIDGVLTSISTHSTDTADDVNARLLDALDDVFAAVDNGSPYLIVESHLGTAVSPRSIRIWTNDPGLQFLQISLERESATPGSSICTLFF